MKKLFLILLVLLPILYSPTPVEAISCPNVTESPPNDAPVVSLGADEQTLNITYEISSSQGSNLVGTFYRNTQPGFITDTSREVATPIGNSAETFDDNPRLNDEEREYALIYQLKTTNGSTSQFSNTLAVESEERDELFCNVNPPYYKRVSFNRIINDALAMPTPNPQIISQTATTITFKIYYSVSTGSTSTNVSHCGSACVPSHPPTHLRVQRASQSTPAYVPWVPGVLSSTANRRGMTGCARDRNTGNNDKCIESRYEAIYTIDLPPNTTDTLTLGGFSTKRECLEGDLGSKTFNVTTQPGNAPALQTPNLTSGTFEETVDNEPYISLQYTNTQAGQVVKLYRQTCRLDQGSCDERWLEGTTADSADETYNSATGKWTFTGSEDLSDLPAGTYWYGLRFQDRVPGSNCSTKTAQVKFDWVPPTCTGNVSLNLIPSSVQTPATTTPSVAAPGSTLNHCTGKTISFRQNSCSGTQINTCTSGTGSSGCNGPAFNVPTTAGSYTYAACIDKNNDTDFGDAGEQSTAVLTVTEPPIVPDPSGPPDPVDSLDCGSGVPLATALVTTPEIAPGTTFPTSGKCIVDPRAAFLLFKIPTYETLKSLHFDQFKGIKSTLSGSPVTQNALNPAVTSNNPTALYIDGSLEINSNPPLFPGRSTPVTIFVRDNLDVKTNITYGRTDQSAGIVFIVAGNVTIDPSVTEINSVIVSSNVIYTAATTGNTCTLNDVETASPLVINGNLISIKEVGIGINFCRRLADNSQAAEKINLQAKYLVILKDLFSGSIQKWSEIP